MVEAARRVAVVRGGSRAGKEYEPVLVTTARPAATGFRSSYHVEENLRYSWLEDYLVRLDGKEARREYYSRLE